MVGADEEGRAPVLAPLEHCSHEGIAAHVRPVDRVAVLRRQLPVVHRMLGIDQPPEHVLHLVGRLEHRHEEIGVHGIQRIQHQRALTVEGVVQVLQEHFLVDLLLVQGPCVLGPAERLVEAQLPRQLRAVGGRAGDRDRRTARIEVDRREVDPHLGIRLHHVEAGDPVHRNHGRDVEFHRVPVAPLALSYGPRPALERDLERVPAHPGELHGDGDVRNPTLVVPAREGVPGPVDHRSAPSHGIQRQAGDLAPHLGVRGPRGVGGEIGEGAHRAPDIGNPQPGKEYARL